MADTLCIDDQMMGLTLSSVADDTASVVRILLFVLGIIIFLALLYYAIGWFNIS